MTTSALLDTWRAAPESSAFEALVPRATIDQGCQEGLSISHSNAVFSQGDLTAVTPSPVVEVYTQMGFCPLGSIV